jgi:hypothetical protein
LLFFTSDERSASDFLAPRLSHQTRAGKGWREGCDGDEHSTTARTEKFYFVSSLFTIVCRPPRLARRSFTTVNAAEVTMRLKRKKFFHLKRFEKFISFALVVRTFRGGQRFESSRLLFALQTFNKFRFISASSFPSHPERRLKSHHSSIHLIIICIN